MIAAMPPTETAGPFRRFRRPGGDTWAVKVTGPLVTTWYARPGFSSSRTTTKDARTPEAARAAEARLVAQRVRQGYVQFSGAKLRPNDTPRAPASAREAKAVPASLPARTRTGDRRLDALLAKVWTGAEQRRLSITVIPPAPKRGVVVSSLFAPLVVPPSFERLIQSLGTLRVEHDGDEALRILTPAEMKKDTRELVRVPRGTRWADDDGVEQRITTDHLVAFAAEGPESRWCFSKRHVGADGELAIFLHHQDEPDAAFVVGTERPIVAKRRPDAKHFIAWLALQARRLAKP
jgi:predicted DNA-binding WGR domain protein